jgi:hypothetical protein
MIITNLYYPTNYRNPDYVPTCLSTIERTLIACISRQSIENRRPGGVVMYPDDTVNWKTSFHCISVPNTGLQGIFIHILVYCKHHQEIKQHFEKGREHFLTTIKHDHYLNEQYRQGFPPRILVEFKDSELCVIM